jgi:hypothetical protein
MWPITIYLFFFFSYMYFLNWDCSSNTCTILCWAKQQGLVRLCKNASVLLWDDFGSTMPILVFIQNNGGIEPFSVKPYMVDPRFD